MKNLIRKQGVSNLSLKKGTWVAVVSGGTNHQSIISTAVERFYNVNLLLNNGLYSKNNNTGNNRTKSIHPTKTVYSRTKNSVVTLSHSVSTSGDRKLLDD